MYKSECMINSMMLRSFEDIAGISYLTEVLKTCYRMNFCSSCFSTMVSCRYALVFLNVFCKHHFLLIETCAMKFSHTEVKVFHESISCFMKCP